ncbi:MAG: HypC/HybG/HupF family hydrogenase formation chaperone [Gammaproteobacteria bacterium]|jgi:hydrogenase expression/formation protein HypC
MCLAIPALITELRDGGVARVDMGGVSKEISVALLDDCTVGDWVIVHVGYALRKLDPVEAERTLELFAAVEPPQ